MRYQIIRNCRIAGQDEDSVRDILIINNKIVHIGEHLLPPSIDTEVYDANGKFALPTSVDTASPFGSLDIDSLDDLVTDCLASGITTWLADEVTTSIPSEMKRSASLASFLANYGFHFRLESLRFFDSSKVESTALTYGITTAYAKLSTASPTRFDRFDQYLELAQRHGLTIVFDIVDSGNTDEHMYAFSTFAEKLTAEFVGKIIFTNVRYDEEMKILANLRQHIDVYAGLTFDPLSDDLSSLSEFTAASVAAHLRYNDWCYATARTNCDTAEYRKFVTYNRLPIIAAMPDGDPLSPKELAEMTSTRQCCIFDLAPEKGRIAIGADADICIWDNSAVHQEIISLPNGRARTVKLCGQIDAVFLNGQMAYNVDGSNGKTEGMPVYRRIL